VNWAVIFDTDSETEITLERIAAICATSIRTYVAPSGRAILGGIGMGSVLAVEVGRLLDSVAGVLVLDPEAASKEAITRAMARLKRMRILRPAQKKNMALAHDLMVKYKFSPVENSKTQIAAVVPKDDIWGLTRQWLPIADIRISDLQTGSFLREPNVLRGLLREVVGVYV
jgi:thioesterase domain-containing protein